MDHQTFAQLLGNYGEFVGAIAVVFTLGYLAVQIRQNTNASKSASYRAVKSQHNSINSAVGQSAELTKLIDKAFLSFDDLDPDEKSQVGWIWLSYTNTWETLFEESRESVELEKLWESEEKTILTAGRMGGYRQWWQQNPWGASQRFREHMDRLMDSLD